MSKWIPSQKQKSGLISRTFEIFIDELAELQDEDYHDKFRTAQAKESEQKNN